MPRHLVAILQPDDFDPSTVAEAKIRDIDVLNEEMEAAGFSSAVSTPSATRSRCGRGSTGRSLPPTARTWRPRSTSEVFTVLKVADPDEALAWGRKAVVACRVPVEVLANLRFNA
jgi:hypothetical protein